MTRILFVDDDPHVLEALRLRLRSLARHWELAFAVGGDQALAEMQSAPCDVVVSDVRMPGMDGLMLLQTIGERWPQTVRIVLSGEIDPAMGARLVAVAHQFIIKPAEGVEIESAIRRCLQLREFLREPGLREAIGRIRQLPPMPNTYAQLVAAMSGADVSVERIASIVESDTVIAARVLQTVNSAFFRLARNITNIRHAITHLGFAAVRNIALSEELFAQWPRREAQKLDPLRLQAHVREIASVAHALARGTRFADDAMLAGLLHDIGYWVLAQECPEALERAVQMAQAERIALEQAETKVLGASHAEIGAYLLGIWGLPLPIVEAVAHHHRPQAVEQTGFDVLASLAVAQALARTDDNGPFGATLEGETVVGEDYLLSVGAPYDWAEARRRAATIGEIA